MVVVVPPCRWALGSPCERAGDVLNQNQNVLGRTGQKAERCPGVLSHPGRCRSGGRAGAAPVGSLLPGFLLLGQLRGVWGRFLHRVPLPAGSRVGAGQEPRAPSPRWPEQPRSPEAAACCYGLTSGSRLLNTERPHLAQGRRNKLSFIAGLDALRSLQTPFLMPSKLLSPRQRLFSFFFLAFPRRRHGTHRGPILLLQHPLRRRGRSAAPGGRFLLPAAGSSPTPEPSSPVPCLWLSMRLPRRLSGAVNELLVHNVWGEMGR